jgi:5-methylcytosine-specific restriction endonuclease McrA
MPTRPPQHRPLGWKPAPRVLSMFDAYYHTPEWRELRRLCLERDGYRCTMADCSTPDRGDGGRLIADHIVERTAGGPNVLSNLRTLCSFCDGVRHRGRRRARQGV